MIADMHRDADAAQPATPGRIQFKTQADLAALPPPSWLIDDLIPDGGLGFLVGAPGAGKSFLLLELAQAVARNLPLFGAGNLKPNRHGWVLALLPESAPSWGARTAAWCDFHGQPFTPDFMCYHEQLNLADAAAWADLIAAINTETDRRGELPALVVVDTLSASIPGSDENSQKDLTPLCANLNQLVADGVSVAVSHHPSKSGVGYRGSSVLLGACDWMLNLTRSGDLRELEVLKLRDAESITSAAFRIEPHGESAVCVPTVSPGPWSVLSTQDTTHPGLRDALVRHGLTLPDGTSGRRAEPTFAAGVTLNDLMGTWRTVTPVRPSSTENRKEYQRASDRRRTALITVVSALIAHGVLRITDGVIDKARRTETLRATIRQIDGPTLGV